MSLAFEPEEIAEQRRVNRLLASAPRLPLRTAWDVAVINGALSLSQALPASNLKRAGVVAEDRRVKAGGRDAMVRILRPANGGCRGVYVDIHGGAWVLGNARMDDRINAQMVETCGIAVVSVDYRLALKNPVHTVLADCETAALWVLENLDREFGADRIFIGGESAGAHLAASTAIRLRDRGWGSKVAAVVLFYGCYDLAGTPSLWAAGPETLVLHGPTLASALSALLADLSQEERRDPALSPLYAELRDLPPALMLVGDMDPLLDDTLLLAERWRAANGNVELHVAPGGPHAFNRLPTRMAKKTNAYVRGWIFGKLAVSEAVRALFSNHPGTAVWSPGAERLAG